VQANPTVRSAQQKATKRNGVRYTPTASQSYKTQDVQLPKTWDHQTDRDSYVCMIA